MSTETPASPAPGVCRVGPDGGPLADKGIGGTGAPLVADRGIGGTGGPVLADRGIGGTGIIAVISGFASICLAGQEVALPATTPIILGSEPASPGQLRAGQVAVVEASYAGTGLSARRVTIRFEVSGPVEATTGGLLRVAGLDVAVTPATLGVRPGVGEWVAVSGIRRADGTIEATRLEQRTPGPVLIHGVLRYVGGFFHVGGLVLEPAPTLMAFVGRNVTISGTLLLDRLQVDQITPDLLASDPATFFGPAIRTVFIEGFAAFGGNRLRFGQGFAAPVAGSIAIGPQRGVYRFERFGSGLRAVAGRSDLGPAPTGLSGGGARGGAFAPAPVPDRSFLRPGAGADGVMRGLPGGPAGMNGGRGGEGRGPADAAQGPPGRMPGRDR